MIKSRIIKNPGSGLTYQIRSFKFEIKELTYNVERDEHIFTGILDLSLEDREIINERTGFQFGPNWYTYKHIPLLYNHNIKRPIGYGSLLRVTHFYPWKPEKKWPKQAWDLRMTGHVTPELKLKLKKIFRDYGYMTDREPEASETSMEKAKEIYDRLKKEGQNAITTISIGYDVEILHRRELTRIYEISIEGKK